MLVCLRQVMLSDTSTADTYTVLEEIWVWDACPEVCSRNSKLTCFRFHCLTFLFLHLKYCQPWCPWIGASSKPFNCDSRKNRLANCHFDKLSFHKILFVELSWHRVHFSSEKAKLLTYIYFIVLDLSVCQSVLYVYILFVAHLSEPRKYSLYSIIGRLERQAAFGIVACSLLSLWKKGCWRPCS